MITDLVKWNQTLQTFKHFFKSNRNIVFLLCLAGFILYANTLPNKMFWDDQDNVLFNQYVHDWRHFPKYFSENVVAGRGLLSNYWRPAVLTFWSAQWHLWQDWAAGYHFTQAALHISAAILLFYALLSLFANRPLAILTALVFLVHPVQTEAIAYATGTSDPLSAIFLFVAIIFWLRFRKSNEEQFKSKNWWIAFLLYPLLLAIRETAIIAPLQIALVDLAFSLRQNKTGLWPASKKLLVAIWPYFVVMAGYLLLRATVLNFANTFNIYGEQNAFTSSFLVRLFTFFRVVTGYFQILFWPFDLHMERTVQLATTFLQTDVLLGGLLLIVSTAAALIFLRKSVLISFAIAWFWLGLAPTSNILIPVNGLMYEHWLYLPMIGVFLAIIWASIQLSRQLHTKSVFVLLFLCFLVFLSVLTIRRNRDWRDPIVFYNQILQYTPDSYRVINNLAMGYADNNQHDQAEEMYKRAILLQPESAVAYHNLGNTYKARGEREKAIASFEKAILLQPDFFFSYNALVNLYLQEGNLEAAKQVSERYNETKHSDPGL